MARARLLPGSNYSTIQYDGEDPSKILSRGGDWVTVTDPEALFLARFHRADVEIDAAPPAAQAHLDQHAAAVQERQNANRIGGDTAIAALGSGGPGSTTLPKPDLTRAVDG